MSTTDSPTADGLNTKVERLHDAVSDLATQISHRSKMRALDFAMNNADQFGAFEYKHKKVNFSTTHVSPEFTKSVLMWFRKGQGTFIDGDIYVSDNNYCHMEVPTEEEKEEFRYRLGEQIHQLTGQQPRIFKKEDGRHAIHYC